MRTGAWRIIAHHRQPTNSFHHQHHRYRHHQLQKNSVRHNFTPLSLPLGPSYCGPQSDLTCMSLCTTRQRAIRLSKPGTRLSVSMSRPKSFGRPWSEPRTPLCTSGTKYRGSERGERCCASRGTAPPPGCPGWRRRGGPGRRPGKRRRRKW